MDSQAGKSLSSKGKLNIRWMKYCIFRLVMLFPRETYTFPTVVSSWPITSHGHLPFSRWCHTAVSCCTNQLELYELVFITQMYRIIQLNFISVESSIYCLINSPSLFFNYSKWCKNTTSFCSFESKAVRRLVVARSGPRTICAVALPVSALSSCCSSPTMCFTVIDPRLLIEDYRPTRHPRVTGSDHQSMSELAFGTPGRQQRDFESTTTLSDTGKIRPLRVLPPFPDES